MLIDEEYGRCGEDDLNRYISDKTSAMKDARALLAECATINSWRSARITHRRW